MEEVIQQKSNSVKSEIQKLLPKIKFNSKDFHLVKDGEFQGSSYSKIWAKMYNDKRTQKPQTNFRKLFFKDGQIKKGKKIEFKELIGLSFYGMAFCNLSALFLNSNNRSVRLVAEDAGVFEIQERKSAFDAYSDGEEEIDPEEGGLKD